MSDNLNRVPSDLSQRWLLNRLKVDEVDIEFGNSAPTLNWTVQYELSELRYFGVIILTTLKCYLGNVTFF